MLKKHVNTVWIQWVWSLILVVHSASISGIEKKFLIVRFCFFSVILRSILQWGKWDFVRKICIRIGFIVVDGLFLFNTSEFWIIGQSWSISHSWWDKLSGSKTFASSELLSVTCVLFASEGEGFIYRWTSCCEESCGDQIVFGEGKCILSWIFCSFCFMCCCPEVTDVITDLNV